MVKKRALRPEEKVLWRKIAKSTRPLSPERLKALDEFAAEVGPAKSKSVSKSPKRPARPVKTIENLATEPVDRSNERRLRRGAVEVDSKIDLHGMTQAEALPALQRFLIQAAQRVDRTVLVITGKGLRRSREPGESWETPAEPGVLRRKLPEWLNLPEIRQLVSGYSVAHVRHGGGGAFYLTIRRPKR
jgi:DNA-nicking Smr family endonuclease